MKQFIGRYGIYFVVFAAVVLRVLFVWQGLQLAVVRDEATYARYAQELLTNVLTYVETYRPSLYPAFLAVWFQWAGSGRFGVEFVQALLEGVNVALVFALTRLLFRQRAAALVAAGLYALYPDAIALTRQFYSETLFNLFVLSAFWLLIRYTPTRARLPIFGAGLLLGAAALTREIAFYFALVVLPLWLLLAANGISRRALVQIGALWFGLGLVLVPWIARNWSIEHRFLAISTSGEFNLIKDNLKTQVLIECGKKSPRPDAGAIKCIPIGAMLKAQYRTVPLRERASAAVRGALAVVSKYPLRWLAAKFDGLNLFWMPPTLQLYYFRVKQIALPLRTALNVFLSAYSILLLWAATLGFVLARNDSSKLLLALYVLYMFAVFIVTHFQPRYREPMFVVLIPFAAFAVVAGARRVRQRAGLGLPFGLPRVFVGILLTVLLFVLIFKNAFY